MRAAAGNLLFGSFGTKVLIGLLLLAGLRMRDAAIVVTILVVWRCVVILRRGRRDNYLNDPREQAVRIDKDKEQWVHIKTPRSEEPAAHDRTIESGGGGDRGATVHRPSGAEPPTPPHLLPDRPRLQDHAAGHLARWLRR